MTHEQLLTAADIAQRLSIGKKAANKLFGQVPGVVFVPRGGLKRQYKELRVPAPLFHRWCEDHGHQYAKRSTAASRSL